MRALLSRSMFLWFLIAFVWAGGAAAAPMFIGFGDLPGGGFETEAGGVSADGSTVVGVASSASGEEGFRWRAPAPGSRTEERSLMISGIWTGPAVVLCLALGLSSVRTQDAPVLGGAVPGPRGLACAGQAGCM